MYDQAQSLERVLVIASIVRAVGLSMGCSDDGTNVPPGSTGTGGDDTGGSGGVGGMGTGGMSSSSSSSGNTGGMGTGGMGTSSSSSGNTGGMGTGGMGTGGMGTGGMGTGGTGGAPCVPTTCMAEGAQCGSIPDNCGNMLNCGGCSEGLTCGGAGIPNQCGAMCTSTCPIGYMCNTQGECVGGSPTGLVLNVEAVNVSGGITLNNMPLVKTCSTSSPATVIFEEINRGYQLSLKAVCDANASFTGTVYPGTYKVSVLGTSFSNLPQGTAYVVHDALNITNPSNMLPLDVLAVNVNGGVTLNGAALMKTCSTSSPATVLLHEVNKGYDLTLNSVCDASASFSGTVYPGTYKVSVQGTSFSNLPQGSPYVVHQELGIANPNNMLPLDVLAVNVNGGVTLNGAALMKTCSTSSPATVLFHEVNKGYDLTLNSVCDMAASFGGTVYPGTYKVSVQGTSFSNLPQGSPYAVHQALSITNPNNMLPLDVLAVNVNGGVTLNGAPLMKTCSTSSPATVRFHEINQGYDLTLNSVCDMAASFNGTVYPGTYKVSVQGTSFSNLPQGSPYVVFPSRTIQMASNMLPLDVLAVNVNGGVTLNGAPLMKTCSTSSPATVLLHEVDQGYDLTLNSLCDMTASFNGTVYPGTYKVSVQGTSFSNLPQGSPYVVYPARGIQNASNMLPLDVLAVNVAGSITLNGMPPMKTCSTSSPATVIFKELAQGYTLTLAAVCDVAFSFAGTVYPGTYDVSVAGTSFSNLPQGSPFLAAPHLVIP